MFDLGGSKRMLKRCLLLLLLLLKEMMIQCVFFAMEVAPIYQFPPLPVTSDIFCVHDYRIIPL